MHSEQVRFMLIMYHFSESAIRISAGQVDVLGIVRELRSDRVSMVQLPIQYEFVQEGCVDFARRNDKQIDLYDPSPPRTATSGGPPAVPVCIL